MSLTKSTNNLERNESFLCCWRTPGKKSPLQRKGRQRTGAAMIEFAFILPVYLSFIFAIIEFGHAMMVMNSLNAVAKDAARYGSYDGISTSNVRQFITDRLGGVLRGRSATVFIKNASSLESSTSNASTVNIQSLTDLELTSAESRQLFLVHIEAPYSSVAIMPIRWLNGIVFDGDSIMRRE